MLWNWIKELIAKTAHSDIQRSEYDFIAIDFETANNKKSSICSCGIVAIKNNQIVKEESWLIKPKELYFTKRNTQIHGIKKEDVINQPQFPEVWPKIKEYVDNNLVLAHNASFDIFALKAVLLQYNLALPKTNYACTVNIAKKSSLGLANCKLNTLAQHFQIPLNHHDALSDAKACAQVAIKICETKQCESVEALFDQLKIKVKSI